MFSPTEQRGRCSGHPHRHGRGVLLLVLSVGVVVGCREWINSNGTTGGDAPVVSTTPAPAATPAAALPLLPPGQHVGVLYPDVAPAARPRVEAAWEQLLTRGATAYVISFSWRDLERAPGEVDVSELRAALAILATADLRILLVIPTIDTNNLQVPDDLRDPSDERRLAAGVRFSDPAVVARFAAVLDAVVPLLRAHGGVALSVGNEVDVWLGAQPAQVADFLAFVRAAQARVAQRAPDLPVAATVTYGGYRARPALAQQIIDAGPVAIFTYYPLRGDFGLAYPFDVAAVFDELVAAAGARPILLQELGCHSGYRVNGVPGSGATPARQAEFFRGAFAALEARPQIRFVAVLALADWSPETVAPLLDYYGVHVPAFGEYLGSLGLLWADGAAKPALAEVLQGVATSAQRRER